MHAAVVVLLCTYLVFLVAGLLFKPDARQWLPSNFLQGSRFHFLAPVACTLVIASSPALLLLSGL